MPLHVILNVAISPSARNEYDDDWAVQDCSPNPRDGSFGGRLEALPVATVFVARIAWRCSRLAVSDKLLLERIRCPQGETIGQCILEHLEIAWRPGQKWPTALRECKLFRFHQICSFQVLHLCLLKLCNVLQDPGFG